MPRWSTRALSLVVACWAVVFAPGAASGMAGSGGPGLSAHEMAVAVLAPTFDADVLMAARPCRIEDDAADTETADAAPVAEAGVPVPVDPTDRPVVVPGAADPCRPVVGRATPRGPPIAS